MADITYWGLTSTKGTVTIADTSTATIDDLISAVASDEGLPTDYYQLSKSTDPSNTLSNIVGDSTLPPSLDALDIGDGDTVYCTTAQDNLTKEERQIQKLEIAAAKRGDTYDITQLPTKYVGNTVVDNANAEGLLENRPWAVPAFTNPTLTIGSAVTTAAFSPFAGGGNSYVFSSNVNSYITTPGSANYSMGTGDFTVEWFSYQTTLLNYQRVFTVGDFPSIEFGVSIESGTFYYWANDSFRYSSATASTTNTWIHWAVVRQSNITKVYKNGTQLGSQITDNNDIQDSATTFVVGNTNTFATNAALVGNLTNFRLVKGLAVYTGNFTVPTSALTATASANPYGGSNTQAIPSGVTKLLLVP